MKIVSLISSINNIIIANSLSGDVEVDFIASLNPYDPSCILEYEDISYDKISNTVTIGLREKGAEPIEMEVILFDPDDPFKGDD